jgi:phosphodiesterase/alkaline phosphatase D-like protein
MNISGTGLIQNAGLKADTTYFYHIVASNGTTASQTMQFRTAKAAGATGAFTAAV